MKSSLQAPWPDSGIFRGRVALCLGLMFAPSAALACALPPSVILTLPTGHYITAAALTVAVAVAVAVGLRH